METWRIYTYDVWGNAIDGYDVNDIFRTPDTFKFNGGSVAELAAAAQKAGYLPMNIEYYDLEWIDNDLVFVNRAFDGKPLGELRMEGE